MDWANMDAWKLLGGAFVVLLSGNFAFARLLHKSQNRAQEQIEHNARDFREEIRENFHEMRSGLREVVRDVAEIKQIQRDFVTREEYRIGMKRAHERIDNIEKAREG